jgi:hypothetical protein
MTVNKKKYIKKNYFNIFPVVLSLIRVICKKYNTAFLFHMDNRKEVSEF